MPLELVKTILAAAAVLLALCQLLVMGQVRGKFKLLPAGARTLIKLHRWGGLVTLAVVTLVGVLCLYVVFGLGYPTTSAHVRSHALLGSAAGIALVLKVVMANWRRTYLRHALRLGVSAAVLLTGAFGASGLVYLVSR